MSELSPSQRSRKYKQALAYLDRCGTLNYDKLWEVNRIAGNPLTEADIQDFVRKAPLILSYGGKPGGMDAVKEELRKSFKEGISVFSSLSDAGVGKKKGCLGVIAILAIGFIIYFLY